MWNWPAKSNASSKVVKPEFCELSADLRWHIASRYERAELMLQGVCSVAVVLLATPMVLPTLNQQMDATLYQGHEIKVFGITVFSTPPALQALGVLPPEALEIVEEGESMAGYRVSSGYGPREAPCEGCSEDHRGVDLATPVGVPIFAPGSKQSRVKVECLSAFNTGGGGITANITSPDIPKLWFQAMHLSECSTGLHPGGSIIARTGDTGVGTAAHLEWRQRDAVTGETQPPQKGYLQWGLTGEQPKTLAEYISPTTAKALIKSFEGFHSTPYWDYQQWTSGYGTPAKSRDEEIDRAIAEQRLQQYIDKVSAEIDALVTVPLNDNQRNALISFQYNTGGLAENTTILRKLNARDYMGAAAEFDQWVHAGGERLEGLVRRRNVEKQLFLSDE